MRTVSQSPIGIFSRDYRCSQPKIARRMLSIEMGSKVTKVRQSSGLSYVSPYVSHFLGLNLVQY